MRSRPCSQKAPALEFSLHELSDLPGSDRGFAAAAESPRRRGSPLTLAER